MKMVVIGKDKGLISSY